MAEAKETMAGWNFKPSKNYGNNHRAYFEEYKMQLAENKTPADSAPTFRVDVPGRAVEHDLLPKTIRAIAELARRAGFSTEYRYSRTWEEGAVFKTGARVGEKRPDKTVDHWALKATKPGLGMILTWDDLALGTAMKIEGAGMEPFANITAVKHWLKVVAGE